MIAIFPPSLSETMNWNVKLLVSLEYQGPMDYIFRNYAVYILDLTAGSSKVAQVKDSSQARTWQTVTQNSRNGPGWKRLNTLAMAVCLCGS